MTWQIQQSIHFSYRDLFATFGNFYDLIASAHLSFLQNAEVKSGPVMCYKQGWHARLVHADADAVTRYARLCHFKYRITDSVSVTNADLVIRQSFNGEILAELTETKITAPEEMFP